jgi:GT2 family glycosyltransferase
MPESRQNLSGQGAQRGLPKVSVIILNWNGYEVTRDCLASLQESNYASFEVILVDNGSDDSSAEKLAQEFGEVRLIKNPTNLGFTGGNNVGMRDALGRGAEYVLLLNNDTVVSPGFLKELVRVAEDDPKIGILNPKIYFFEPTDMIWYGGGMHKPWWSFPKHIDYLKRDSSRNGKPREVSFVTGCACLIKREVVSRVGLLDEHFFFGVEDLDWSIRIVRAGFKAVYVPSAFIWHKVSVTANATLGVGARDYYHARNSIFVARKHLQPKYWPLFLLSMGRYLAYATAVHLVKVQPEGLKALYKGVWSGCSTAISE